MTLVNSKKILEDAKRNNYAIGAFNVYNIEDTIAVISAAEEVKSPVILMTSESAINHTGLYEFAKIISIKAKNSKIPICLHLDHAKDFNLIIKAIHAGYSSIMFDGSKLSLEDNIERTREIVKIAKIFNVNVEGEIGIVGNDEENEKEYDMVLTDPEQAQKFCNKTNIDSCAVAIGTQHGMQSQEAKINFDVLKKIRSRVNIPLVLHGSSGVKNDDLKGLSNGLIQKVNIGTKLKRTFTDSLKENTSKNKYKDLHNHIKFLNFAIDSVKEEVINKLHVISCINKA